MEFAGFVEGDDIAEGTVDVVVTDGFTGNVALKTAEGTAKLVVHFLRSGACAVPLLGRIGGLLASGALNALRRKLDPRASNGGIFLGLNGVVVKSHGGTDAHGLCQRARHGHRHGARRGDPEDHRRPRRGDEAGRRRCDEAEGPEAAAS